MTDYIVPLILFVSMALALGRKENAYDIMLSGAADGLRLIVSILPALILLLCAVHMLQASGAAEAINKIHDAGYLAICVTNQPVVARGECTPQEMANILANLEMLLGKEGAYLDAIYYCPHYPKEFPGSDKRFTKECRCRKPGTGLVEEATKAFNIDLSSSWFIGDTCRDVKTGQNAGTHTALLLSGDPNPGKRYGEAVPEKTYQNLKEAIDDILG